LYGKILLRKYEGGKNKGTRTKKGRRGLRKEGDRRMTVRKLCHQGGNSVGKFLTYQPLKDLQGTAARKS